MAGVSRSVSPRAAVSVPVAPNTWIRRSGRTRRLAGSALVCSVGFTAMFLISNHQLHHPMDAAVAAGAFFFGMAALGLGDGPSFEAGGRLARARHGSHRCPQSVSHLDARDRRSDREVSAPMRGGGTLPSALDRQRWRRHGDDRRPLTLPGGRLPAGSSSDTFIGGRAGRLPTGACGQTLLIKATMTTTAAMTSIADMRQRHTRLMIRAASASSAVQILIAGS